ncbi:glycosyltransferase family 4 protein [Flavobacterium sp.]|jgi:glycosyltransferase involved in cell wall biosynthesis|uniref:glycosyltransferase family 4 protein n=1 Tax=Flavobacterium sp. TaxID=239 RepID=UPI0022BCDFEA|nr:glycosyltransferase family 4 protein [Flavobacterium sp.]MCZ8230039.1 glycosyltransferase family 4 protein [Flavobacterium sp.]
MSEKKILHVITVSFVINHFFGEQFLYLKKKSGNEYYLACSSSKELTEFSKKLGYVPLEVEITREISPLKDLKAIYEIYNHIKKNGIDIVVGHTPKGGMIAMIASFLAGASERIYFRHGIIYETSKGFRKQILKNIERLTGFFAKTIICVSYSVKEISEKDNLNKANKNVILGLGTCNGIDTEGRFNPKNKNRHEIEELAQNYNISLEDKVVGYVGRLVKDKGIDDLILAWKIVKDKFPNAKLLLVGPIEERDAISEYSKNQIQTDSSIIFTDFVVDASIYFSIMDIFVLPTYREGFSTVSLEASSMKLPVLITKATGCKESIIENQSGLFISNEPLDIAEKIFYYFENEHVMKEHGMKGRIFVQENFEQTKIWDLISNQLKL